MTTLLFLISLIRCYENGLFSTTKLIIHYDNLSWIKRLAVHNVQKKNVLKIK